MHTVLRRIAIMLFVLTIPLSGNAENPSDNFTTISLVMYSGYGYASDQQQMDRICIKMNDMLDRLGHKVQIDIDVQPFDKIRDMHKYNRPFYENVLLYDLYFESAYDNSLTDLVDHGMVYDITELLSNHNDLRKIIPAECWREISLDGKIYGIPTYNTKHSEGVWNSGIMIRTDIVSDLGIDMPTTPDELLDLALMAKEQGFDYQLAYDMSMPPYAFHRTYDEWPFFVDQQSLYIIESDGGLTPYLGSSVFDNDRTILSMFQESGVLKGIHPNDNNAASSKWDFLAAMYPLMYGPSTPNSENIEIIQFAPDMASYRMQRYNDMHIYLSSLSEKADAALTLIEAIYTNQELYDVFIFGIEGEDWFTNDNSSVEILNEVSNWLTIEDLSRSFWGLEGSTSVFSLPAKGGNVIDFPGVSFQYAPEDYSIWQKVQDVYWRPQNGLSFYLARLGISGLSSKSGLVIDEINERLSKAGYPSIIDEITVQYQRFLDK